MQPDFFRTPALKALLRAAAPLYCLDVGARGRPLPELAPLAPALAIYGFEPDPDECERLNRVSSSSSSPFAALKFFPAALGRGRERRRLYLTRRPGSSSLLEPLPEVGLEFSRSDYVEVERVLEVDTWGLDDFLAAAGLGGIDFMKIDCEGAELEILGAAPRLLADELLALRVETAFLATRREQPLFSELESFLRARGFELYGFEELHCWRQLSRRKYPKRSFGVIPFARGRLAHADLLFVRKLSWVRACEPRRIARLALVLMVYGYLEQAFTLLGEPSLKPLLQTTSFDVAGELGRLSRLQERAYLSAELRHLPAAFVNLLFRLLRNPF